MTSECIVELFSRTGKRCVKEISESFGILEAALNHIPNISNMKVYVIGDGSTPRTGVVFAYFTKANVISIDPQANLNHYNIWYNKQDKIGQTPKNIQFLKCKSSEFIPNCEDKDILVVWPHSHAPLNSFNPVNYKSRRDIILPCCIKIVKIWQQKPHIVYVDEAIISPKNKIYIY